MPIRSIRRKRTDSRLRQNTQPVVIVHRSNQTTSAQVLDPKTGNTLFSATSAGITEGTKTEKAKIVGAQLAQKLAKSNIDTVVFHRNGFVFRGRVQAIAEGLRENNINV